MIDQAVETGAPLIPFSGTELAAGDIPLAEDPAAGIEGAEDSGAGETQSGETAP